MGMPARADWLEPDDEQPLDVPEEPTEQHLTVFDRKATALSIVDDQSLHSAAEFVEQCKLAAKRVEEKRKLQVDPLNAELEKINGALIPVRDAFKALAKRVSEQMGKFLEDRRIAAEEAQRRAQAEAAAKQAELDRKAEEARQAAAQAAAKGDTKAAIKAESQALKLEQKAADTVAEVVPQVTNKIDLGGASLSVGKGKMDWTLVGWDKKKPLPALDPLLKSLVKDFDALPEGVRFLLQYSDLNPVRLNAAHKAGVKFPKPFGETRAFGSSTLRS